MRKKISRAPLQVKHKLYKTRTKILTKLPFAKKYFNITKTTSLDSSVLTFILEDKYISKKAVDTTISLLIPASIPSNNFPKMKNTINLSNCKELLKERSTKVYLNNGDITINKGDESYIVTLQSYCKSMLVDTYEKINTLLLNINDHIYALLPYKQELYYIQVQDIRHTNVIPSDKN